MTKKHSIPRIATGVRNLDEVLHGGLPKGSVSVVAGPPGAGKTILTQQICFHTVGPAQRVLYFNTLSEPTAKTLRYLSEFSFFDPKPLDEQFQFVDLGVILRLEGLAKTSELVMEQVKRVKPAVVVIDSFKAFEDLAKSQEQLRKFTYELAVNLMAWEATCLLLGEYGPLEYVTNPLFSVVDGLIALSHREESGEQQRFIRVIKMRGTAHNRDEHPFVITSDGVEVFAPRVAIQRSGGSGTEAPRLKTGIDKLDELLGSGIPRGSSLLVAGVAGTGKTVLGLEFIYRGALAGEKGIIFSFEETAERLLAAARGLGWDLEKEIEEGRVEIVFIPQPDILVEANLLMLKEHIESFGAKRVVIDSVSVFLHKITNPQFNREKVFQLASVVQNTEAVGFFATDVPYGHNQISRLGVEETVVDGVILLSAVEEGLERQRYIEVYKLRNTAHLKGRHDMEIAHGGVQIFPRYTALAGVEPPPPPLDLSERLGTGVGQLDALLNGGLLRRSATLVTGGPGVGKTTLGLQFLLEGASRGESGIMFSVEEGPPQMLASADSLGLPLRRHVEEGTVEIVYLPREHTRAAQFLSLVGDAVARHHARRVVLDSVTQLVWGSGKYTPERDVLARLVSRFKQLGATSLLTLEVHPVGVAEEVTRRGLSAISDNLFTLHYVESAGALQPTLTVLKTRGSAHDRGSYALHFEPGGLRLGDAKPPEEQGSEQRR